MKIKNFFIVMLIVESALVLSGLLMKRDVWGIIVCYWAVLLVKNISDYIDEKRKEDDGG